MQLKNLLHLLKFRCVQFSLSNQFFRCIDTIFLFIELNNSTLKEIWSWGKKKKKMGTKIFIYVWINKHSNQLKNYYSNILIKPIFVPVNILKMNFALSIQPFFASRSNNLTVIFFHSVWIKNSSKIHCPFLNVYSFDLKNPYLFIYLFIHLFIYLFIYLFIQDKKDSVIMQKTVINVCPM